MTSERATPKIFRLGRVSDSAAKKACFALEAAAFALDDRSPLERAVNLCALALSGVTTRRTGIGSVSSKTKELDGGEKEEKRAEGQGSVNRAGGPVRAGASLWRRMNWIWSSKRDGRPALKIASGHSHGLSSVKPIKDISQRTKLEGISLAMLRRVSRLLITSAAVVDVFSSNDSIFAPSAARDEDGTAQLTLICPSHPGKLSLKVAMAREISWTQVARSSSVLQRMTSSRSLGVPRRKQRSRRGRLGKCSGCRSGRIQECWRCSLCFRDSTLALRALASKSISLSKIICRFFASASILPSSTEPSRINSRMLGSPSRVSSSFFHEGRLLISPP
eukprot:m.626826 g.626826  ORF g.626826 m.626826 type:complete len:334 (+) comp58248_c0_seq4:4684-5685(+)